MPFFTVMTPPGKAGAHDAAIEAEVIRDGFNWSAFTFSGFWLLYKRLWLAFAAVALLYVIAFWMQAEMGLPAGAVLVVDLAIRLFIGHEASSFLERKRRRQGWRLADVVEAANLEHAERRYFARHVAAFDARPRPVPAMARGTTGAIDSGIGLFAEPRGR